MRPIKHAEKCLTLLAGAVFDGVQVVNKYKPNPSFTPKWSDKPLLKSWQKTKPTLGWPRTTDSLCPKCVPEIRQQILDGKLPYDILLNEKVGEIKAQIVERDGKILMIDQTTGRVAPGRVWSKGLHQLLEVKEGCAPTGEMETIAQITYQRFFPRYLRLCGMSGTLTEAADELGSVYSLSIDATTPGSRALARDSIGSKAR
jgi:hypothetical protein